MSVHDLRLAPTSSSLDVLVLEFVRRYFRDYGRSPVVPEIAAAFRVSNKRVYRVLHILEARGELLWTPGTRRSIKLPDRCEELSDSEVLLVLIRRGFRVVGARGNVFGTVPGQS